MGSPEYRCNACGREFEYQQRMADPDLVTCEACGEDKLEKLISATAFQLKGGGWYSTDYSRKAATSDSKAATSDSKAATSESKTDSSTKPSEKVTKTKESSTTSTD